MILQLLMPVHNIYTMALAAGFEPAGLFRPPVFKTGGLNQTLPSKHIKLSLQNYEWLRRTSRQCFLGRKSNQNTNIARLKKNYHCYWWWYAHLESNQEIPKITAAYKTGTLTIV